MIKQLEEEATENDKISGIPTTCVAVADDVAPCATAEHPRDALHSMQHLLNVVEDHGTQLHMRFGKAKCKLLISGRPKMVKNVENMLKEEPELLTFYGSPVNTVEDHYVHIGVPHPSPQPIQSDYRLQNSKSHRCFIPSARIYKKCIDRNKPAIK